MLSLLLNIIILPAVPALHNWAVTSIHILAINIRKDPLCDEYPNRHQSDRTSYKLRILLLYTPTCLFVLLR